MGSSTSLDFELANDQLLALGAVNSMSELQGVLCGKLCGGMVLTRDDWREHAIEFLGLEHVALDAEHKALFENMLTTTSAMLLDGDFGLALMLPGDESSIDRRTEYLGQWCQGFLVGVGSSGLKPETALQPDTAETLRDLADISQVVVGEDDDKEECERHWGELVEYVKVSVLSLYVELAGKSSSEADDDPLSVGEKGAAVSKNSTLH